MDALAPFACLPVQIAGRNRMMRYMAIQDIKLDPAWMNGEYKTEPQEGLRGRERDCCSSWARARCRCRSRRRRAKQAEQYVDRYLERTMRIRMRTT